MTDTPTGIQLTSIPKQPNGYEENFPVLYKMFFLIPGDTEKQAHYYHEFKKIFMADLAALIIQNPDFKPKIRFDDAACTVEVGHAYRELMALLPEEAKSSHLLPKKHPFPGPRAGIGGHGVDGIPVIYVSPQESTLVRPGENTPFARDGMDEGFSDAVDGKMATHLPCTYSLPRFTGVVDKNLVANIAKPAAGAAGQLRLFVGENHNDDIARRLIVEAMPEIEKAGASLCLEHFFYESQQTSLDNWILRSPKDAPMPLALERYVKYLDKSFGLDAPDSVGFEAVLYAAKKHGVRVVALDTEAVYAIDAGIKGDRVANFNYVASQIIAKEIGNGSFVASVGNAHCAKYIEYSMEGAARVVSEIPGLDQLCGAASLAVFAGKDVSPTITERDDSIRVGHHSKSDITISIKPDLSLVTDGRFMGRSSCDGNNLAPSNIPPVTISAARQNSSTFAAIISSAVTNLVARFTPPVSLANKETVHVELAPRPEHFPVGYVKVAANRVVHPGRP